MTIHQPLCLLAVLGVAGLGVAGCGTTTLDMSKAEKEIAKGVEQQTGSKGVKIDCPSEVEIKKGDTFDCTAVDADGTKGKIVVTQKDDDGNISWQLR